MLQREGDSFRRRGDGLLQMPTHLPGRCLLWKRFFVQAGGARAALVSHSGGQLARTAFYQTRATGDEWFSIRITSGQAKQSTLYAENFKHPPVPGITWLYLQLQDAFFERRGDLWTLTISHLYCGQNLDWRAGESCLLVLREQPQKVRFTQRATAE